MSRLEVNGCVATLSYPEMSLNKFTQAKQRALQGVDLSKKGSVDEAVRDIIKHLNSQSQYFTTSSCSGRTIIVVSFIHSLSSAVFVCLS